MGIEHIIEYDMDKIFPQLVLLFLMHV